MARALRRHATDVEQMMWRALSTRCPAWKFRRQHPIGRRIADFACPAGKLVIELDGGQHAEHADADAVRTAELTRHGWRAIRFWNRDVLDNIDGVLETIVRELERAPHLTPPSPPLGAEREWPAAKRWEGEAGRGVPSGIPHLTPTLSAPRGRRGSV